VRRRTEKMFHLVGARQRVQVRRGCCMTRCSCRIRGRGGNGFLCRSVRRPCALSESRRPPSAVRRRRRRVRHQWHREGACRQDAPFRRSAASCAHSQPHNRRSHDVRGRSVRSW
jgi:hypothetical protein